MDLSGAGPYIRQKGLPSDRNRSVGKALPEKYRRLECNLLPVLQSRNNHFLTLLASPLLNLYLNLVGLARVQIMVLLHQALRNLIDS